MREQKEKKILRFNELDESETTNNYNNNENNNL